MLLRNVLAALFLQPTLGNLAVMTYTIQEITMNIDLPAKFKKTSLCCHVKQEIEESRRRETRRIEVKSIQSAIFLYSNIISKRIPIIIQNC
ncbi:hypothetical protein EAY18_25080 [Vibrio anguillarum]|nr:hypothetical protein [Vibrio anguillarum]MBF4442519.1 hypothetical protein [Vibrio anguillarum]